MKLSLEIADSWLTVVAAPPALVSQRTAELHLGIGRRQYLAAVQAYRAVGGDVIRCGRLRLVEPTAFVEWLRRRDCGHALDHSVVADRIAAGAGMRLVR